MIFSGISFEVMILAVQVPGNRFTNPLRETSKALMPGEEKFDEILQSVMEKVGSEETVHYAKAVSKMESIASSRLTRIVDRIIAIVTGTAVVAAGLFLAMSIRLQGERVGFQIVDRAIPLTELPAAEQRFSVPAAHSDVSYLREVWTDADYLYISLDYGSDWERIYGISATGEQVYPAEVVSEAGLVKFWLPSEPLALYVLEESGNEVQIAADLEN